MRFKHLVIGFGIVLIFFATILFGGGDSNSERTQSTSERTQSTSGRTQSTKEPSVPTLTFTQWKMRAEEIPYDTLLRNAEQHKGKLVYFRGMVGFVNEFSGTSEIKVRVRKGGYTDWDTDSEVLLKYRNPAVRVLEGDIVTFVGEMEGVWGLGQVPEITLIALEIE